jgi:hypothetical protein
MAGIGLAALGRVRNHMRAVPPRLAEPADMSVRMTQQLTSTPIRWRPGACRVAA